MSDQDLQVIAHMRGRAEQCRRLAAALTDQRASDALLKMAEEVEADIARLEARGDETIIPPQPQAE